MRKSANAPPQFELVGQSKINDNCNYYLSTSNKAYGYNEDSVSQINTYLVCRWQHNPVYAVEQSQTVTKLARGGEEKDC